MLKPELGSAPELHHMILRSIMHSKSLDDFCKKLSLIFRDSTLTCEIRELINFEEFKVIGTSKTKHEDERCIDYPDQIRSDILKNLIGSTPGIYFEQNQIWRNSDFSSESSTRGNSLLVIPSAHEGQNLTWIEFRHKVTNARFPISLSDTHFLQWALAIKLGLFSVNSLEGNQGSTPSFRDYSFLTKRQRQIVKLIEQGQTNNQIAGQLHVSPSLVKYEISRVFRHLGIRKRSELFE
jgi:DNA-binding CsgD family transcriptional regulator